MGTFGYVIPLKEDVSKLSTLVLLLAIAVA